MGQYWGEHSKNGTIQEMMLDVGAEDLSKEELPEILSYLPPVDDLDVVELGAGIGRFTSHVAEKARSVLAVDFMESFIEKNKERNDRFRNIEYLAADVMHMSLETNDWDLIFSNWLYMYLDTTELTTLLRRMLAWLRLDGYMFCRESCNRQSGNKPRTNNPSYYRDVLVYEALFTSVTIPTEDGKGFYGFDTILSRPVDTYIKQKQNENQITWLVQKVRRDIDTSSRFSVTQKIQDFQQTDTRHALHMERIVGRGFTKTGGMSIAKASLAVLDIQKGHKVLDFDCGIGGFAIHVAKETGAKVLASDRSATSVKIGRDRSREKSVQPLVDFEVSDITRRTHQPESFDVIYSRDLFHGTADIFSLLKQFMVILRPRGKVLFACTSQYSGKEVEAVAAAGFTNIREVPMTDIFTQSLESELESIQQQFDEEFDDVLKTKQEDLQKLRQGQSTWGFIYAEKH